MAERLDQSTQNYDSISATDFPTVFNSAPRRSQSDDVFEDDLIQSLQNHVENARARQVFEWESVRRQVTQLHRRGAA